MDRNRPSEDVSAVAREILGYLNFSSGASDPKFLENVNKLFGGLAARRASREPAWRALDRSTPRRVAGRPRHDRRLPPGRAGRGGARLVFDAVLPAYREFHRDLLFHQTDEALFQPFFIGRVCEAVLQQGGPWEQADRIVPAALRQLNDYHRPPARGRASHRTEDSALRPRMGPPDPAMDSRGGGGRRALPRTGRNRPGHSRRRRSRACCSTPCSRSINSTSWRSIRGRTTSTIRSTSGPTICSANGT